MKNPYDMLVIEKSLTIEGVLKHLRGFIKGNSDIFSDKDYEELVSSLKCCDKEEEQNQIVLDALVKAKYKFFSQINEKRMKNTLDSKKLEELQNRQEDLKKAYETISTESNRKIYAEKERNRSKEKDFFEKQIEDFLNLQAQLENLMCTQKVVSKLDEWEVEINDYCLINEKDINGRDIVVTRLGTFKYKEFPIRREKFSGTAEVIGVTKVDRKSKTVKTDIVVGRLKLEDRIQNKEFFRDILLSDKLINHAQQNNCGFVGSIAVKNKDGVPYYYIEYNGDGDQELVSTLEIAKYTNGVVKNKGAEATAKNFEELKEKLAQIQENYAINLIQSQAEAEGKGEDRWRK